MKKKLKSILILIIVLLISTIGFYYCDPEDNGDTGDTGDSGDSGDTGDSGEEEGTIIGKYLKVEVTGVYFDETSGTFANEPTTLETTINLYSEITKNGKISAGFFNQGGGLVMGSLSGIAFGGTVIFGGVAHVNGLIAKGPFETDSFVTVKLLDENMNEISIDPLFQDDLEGLSDGISSFNFEFHATENVEIPININILTSLQSKRLKTLKDEGLNYADAYEQSKVEVLEMFNLGEEANILNDFEKMSITDNDENGAVLLMASSVMLNIDDDGESDPETRNNADFLEEFLQNVSQNGAITNENINDVIKENLMRCNFSQVQTFLQNYYDAISPGTVIPDSSPFQDADGDGLIDRLEIVLNYPIGISSNNTPTFDWNDLVIPGITVGYVIQISNHKEFIAHETFTSSTLSVSEFPIPTTHPLIAGVKYYWRVAPVINGIRRMWSNTTAFLYDSIISEPYGTMEIAGGQNSSSRLVVIDTSGIYGAVDMRFSNDGIYDKPWEDWKKYELYKVWLLPKNTGQRIIQAQFRNSEGFLFSSVFVYFNNTLIPSGSFNINNGNSETYQTSVLLDARGVNNAFKMRYSNDGTFDTEEWKPYQPFYQWELLAGTDGLRTVYAEFKNSNGVHSTNTSVTLNTNATPSGSFVINGGDSATNNRFVELNLFNISCAEEMRFTNNLTFTTEDWIPYSPRFPWILSNGMGPKTVKAQFRTGIATYDTDDSIDLIQTKILTLYVGPGGTVRINLTNYTPSPDPYTFQNLLGTDITLEVIPNANYHFSRWIGNVGNVIDGILPNNYEIKMDSNKTLKAVFEQDSYDLTILTSGIQTILTEPSGTIKANHNVSTPIKALTIDGYSFSGWTILSGTPNITNPLLPETTVTITGNATIQANYTKKSFNITRTVASNSIGLGAVSGDSGSFTFESLVTISATPSGSNSFVGWYDSDTGGNLISTNKTFIFKIRSNLSLFARFTTQSAYSLTVNAHLGSGSGNIQVSPQPPYLKGSNTLVTVLAVPDRGSKFDGFSTGKLENTIKVMMDSDKVINATFNKLDKILILEVTDYGHVEIDGLSYTSIGSPHRIVRPYGTTLTMNVIPDSGGFLFNNWTGKHNSFVVGTSNPYTIQLDYVRNLIANFKPNDKILTLNVGTNGNVYINRVQYGPGTHPIIKPHGEIVIMVVRPNPTFYISSWGGDIANVIGKKNPFAIIMNDNRAISVGFSLSSSLELTVVGNGAVRINDVNYVGGITANVYNVTVPRGINVEMYVYAGIGSIFGGWSGSNGGDVNGSGNPYTINCLVDRQITATFN